MINPKQFIKYVLRPTLKPHDWWSPSAERLLMGTMAQESHCGQYLHQIGGPALGVFQMEPATLRDLWSNWLKFRGDKSQVLSRKSMTGIKHDEPLNLIYSLPYATLATRFHYMRVPQSLPEEGDWQGYAWYWKEHYNTVGGKGTEEEFLHNCIRFLSEVYPDEEM